MTDEFTDENDCNVGYHAWKSIFNLPPHISNTVQCTVHMNYAVICEENDAKNVRLTLASFMKQESISTRFFLTAGHFRISFRTQQLS